ncbi:MAG TPA: DEAD/DEAH box helicase [Candidatus Anammoximicrobium sp.]|nr:DEAD/DEAH box helicase [Candidatus Anammoximicrobium sp.]
MSASFEQFQLLPSLLRAVGEEAYTTPTPVQVEAIPHVLAGRDLLGCAQTGTGKTAAFALPILHRLDQSRRPAVPGAPRVLVVCPTRELAAQIGSSFQAYGRHLRFRQAVIFGGVGQNPQVRALAHGVHVLIATPGRLLDLMHQRHVRLNGLDTFVLDEADRMLDLGFLPDLKRIIACLPTERQSLFFSATLPDRIVDLSRQLLRNPVRVSVTPPATTVELIDQRVLFVEQTDKRALLSQLLQAPAAGRVLVFTRTKRRADHVAQQLSRSGIRADAIHGDKSQTTRERLLHGFRTGKMRVLVATDLASRGIDVDGITHVINYDLPHEPESYVHRIGRTGRAGAAGTALSFCDASERGCLQAIEKLIRRRLQVQADHPYHSALAPATAPRRTRAGRTSVRPGAARSRRAW